MSPAENSAAFERLVATRARLNEITRLLNALRAHKDAKALARYRQLQEQWDTAFSAFETATREFSAAVSQMQEDVENHRPKLPSED